MMIKKTPPKGIQRTATLLIVLATISPIYANEAAKRHWSKDPFRSTIDLRNMTENLEKIPPVSIGKLNGIVEIEHRYRAMIDDRMLKEGAYIGGYRIQKIVAQRVFLSNSRGIIFRLEFDSDQQ
jgi:hypothetical protein